MAENAESSSQRDRSPSYPLIPLEAALDRLTAFEAHFKRSPARPDKVQGAWGLKAKARVDRIAAALRYFGLLDYQGTGKDRQIVVSDEGRKYLRAQQDEIKHKVVKAAALRPKEIAKFWNEWGEDRPADAACLDDLVFKHGFSEAGARDFLKVYDATISFAGLSGSDKMHSTDDGDDSSDGDRNKAAVGDLIQWVSGGELQFAQAVRVRAVSEDEQWVFVEDNETGLPMTEVEIVEKGAPPPPGGSTDIAPPTLPLEKSWREERLLDDEGQEIFIRYEGAPSVGRYEFIRDYLSFKIGRLQPKNTKKEEPAD